MIKFGEIIKEARLSQGMSIWELAQKSDIQPNTIRYWENGERNPTLDNAERVLIALNTNIVVGKVEP